MKAYICEECGKQEKPDRYENLVPPGWFSIYHRASEHEHRTTEVCSITCVRDLIDRRVTEAVAMLVPEPVRG